MQTTTATEILAYCTSCKMDLAAVIVAKVGAKIAKVQCKTCKKEHTYKSPKGVKQPDLNQATRRPSGDGATSVEQEWKKLMSESDKAKRVKYSPKSTLTLGDIVQHSSFGDGIVVRLSYPNKVEVIFKSDVKVLIHSRV